MISIDVENADRVQSKAEMLSFDHIWRRLCQNSSERLVGRGLANSSRWLVGNMDVERKSSYLPTHNERHRTKGLTSSLKNFPLLKKNAISTENMPELGE